MHLSVVISVLNSHSVVQRQIRHFRSLRLPNTVEFIIMDDGSDPPLEFPRANLPNLRIVPTHDTRLWTCGIARMKGSELATGDYILFTDIDHIIPKPVFDVLLKFDGDRMQFPRKIAILNKKGQIILDPETLMGWGYSRERYRRRGLNAGMHINTFAIRREVWKSIGGYSRRRINIMQHTMGEDREFNHRYNKSARAGRYKHTVMGPTIYCYPVGRFHQDGNVNPYGLFHDQPRDDLGQC